MIYKFNDAQFERCRRDSLKKVLDLLQAENDIEIEVSAYEFPEKFIVNLGDDSGIMLAWDAEKQTYAEWPMSEPEPSPETDLKPEPSPEPEKETDLEPVTDPIQLAQLTYELLKHFKRLSPEEKITFTTEYLKLWKGGE